jgi:YfiH family protein
MPAAGGLLCGISLEAAGDMALSRRGELPWRAKLESALGVPASRTFGLRQVHSKRLVVVGDQSPEELAAIEADGMLTLRQDVLLTVTVADCLPIVLVDTKRHGLGIVHSGWKGTGIAADAVRAMQERFGSLARDISVTIGPGIGACCYRVSEERAEMFEAEFGPGSVVNGADGTPRLDLLAVNTALLEKSGVGSIAAASDCTGCTPGLGSLRRQGAAGCTLMLAYIGGAQVTAPGSRRP